MKRKIYIGFGIVVLILMSAEIYLRIYWGFCDAVLIKEDADYEYIAQPNQKRFRFRHTIYYNKESMRSDEIDTSAIKVLFFGDSIINGGTLTDQDSLATTILSDTLSAFCNKKIQVLNISAGSWGPDNCYAYLNKNGNYDAKYIFLIVSSHDAYDNMDFEKVVGKNAGFPDKQYKSAIYELLDRYLLPRLSMRSEHSTDKESELGINKKKIGSSFNSGFKSFSIYTQKHNIPFIIFLHAETKELKAGKYNEEGQEIIQFAREQNLPIIEDLKNGLEASDFRDGIHLNEKGQKKLSKMVLEFLFSQVSQSNKLELCSH